MIQITPSTLLLGKKENHQLIDNVWVLDFKLSQCSVLGVSTFGNHLEQILTRYI
jgi:hypothetical protein